MKINCFFLILICTLFGCNDDAKSPTPPDERQTSLNVIYKSATIGVKNNIELNSPILSLSSFYNDDSCEVLPDSSELEFKYTFNKAGVCIFKYEVVQNEKVKYGFLVLNTDSKNYGKRLVQPIKKEYEQSEDVTININSELFDLDFISNKKNDLLYHFAFLSNMKGELFKVEVDNESNTISVPSQYTYDYDRIIYFVKATNGDLVKGLVYLEDEGKHRAISNNPPSTTKFTISVEKGKSNTIDLTDYVSDVDDDNLQLIGVMGDNDLGAKVANLNDVSNLKMNLHPSSSGRYDLNYIISDHRGGISLNIIRFEVKNNSISEDGLKNIKINDVDVMFHYPKNTAEANDSNYLFVDSYTEDGSQGISGVSYPIYQKEYAQGICTSVGGHLPTQSDLEMLFDQENNLFSTNRWPVTIPYLAIDSALEPILIDMATGNIVGEGTKSKGYLTCVSYVYNAIQIFQKLIPIDYPTKLNVFALNDGIPVPVTPLIKSWSVDDTSIATINDAGIILGIKEGVVNVSAETVDGVKVEQSIRVSFNLLTKDRQIPSFDNNPRGSYADGEVAPACAENISTLTNIDYRRVDDGSEWDAVCVANGVLQPFSGKGYLKNFIHYYEYYGKNLFFGREFDPRFDNLANDSVSISGMENTKFFQYFGAFNISALLESELDYGAIDAYVDFYQQYSLLKRYTCRLKYLINFDESGDISVTYVPDVTNSTCGDRGDMFTNTELVYNQKTKWFAVNGIAEAPNGGDVFKDEDEVRFMIHFGARPTDSDLVIPDDTYESVVVDELIVSPYYAL